MDLYSADVGAIQEGNMRSQAVMDANNKIKQHNDDLAGQIQNLKTAQKTGDIEEGIKDMAGGFIASGKIKGKVQAYKDWVANQKASNPTTQEDNKMSENTENESGASTTEEPKSKLTDTGDGIFVEEGDEAEGVMSRAKTGIKNALGVSDEALDVAGKGLGEIASVGMAGMDIYKDFQGGKGFHLAGDNWASKTSNALQIGGAIADLGGTVFPPLALLGGAVDIASGVAGEIGDFIDSGKQEQETDKLQQQETQQQISAPAQAPVSTGRTT